ncbi:unnamed protein product, partial [marine sediment metagenome]
DMQLTRRQVEDRIHGTAASLANPALAAANIYSIGKSDRSYEINTTETNKTTVVVTFAAVGRNTTESITAAIKKTQDKFGEKLSDLVVVPQTESNPAAFVITTSQLNKSVVKHLLENTFPDADISE